MGAGTRSRVLPLLGILLGLWLVLGGVCWVAAEHLWFAELGYSQVFWLRLATQVSLWVVTTGLSVGFFLGNLALAQRLKHPHHSSRSDVRPASSPRSTVQRPAQRLTASLSPPQDALTVPLVLRWLLPLTLGLSVLVGLLLLHYTQATLTIVHPSPPAAVGLPALPDRLRLESLGKLVQQLLTPGQVPFLPYLKVGSLLVGAIALLLYTRVLLLGIALVLGLEFGFLLCSCWSNVLQFLSATPFHRSDPLFGRDIGFYVFALPVWELLEFWLVGLFLYGLVSVALTYLLSGDSLSQGRFVGFSGWQRRHLAGLAGCGMLAVSLSYWLSRYELLYSTRGVAYGASYTDVKVSLPADTLLSGLAVAIALWLLSRACLTIPKLSIPKLSFPRHPQSSSVWLLASYGGLVLLANFLLPALVQQLVVQPNELAREQPYIRRSIALTREAFALEAIDIESFNPQGNLTYQDLKDNAQTIRNIRLWDTRPLLETDRQLQQIRPYYRFFDADIDRYTLPGEEPADAEVTRLRGQESGASRQARAVQGSASRLAPRASPLPSEKQQVLISARELDYSAVPAEAQTWVNEHLVYTHGYGFTVSPVNRVAPGGLPDYFVKNIGTGINDRDGGLTVASERIRASIPIAHPRIYYGELTNTYILTRTRVSELDYPSGNDNVYTRYDGTGGLFVGGWRRWLFARYLNDWQMLLTNHFTQETKLLFRRNLNDRIRTIAPFLRYDHDPYLVVANLGRAGLAEEAAPSAKPRSPNYLYWIVDAYTASDRYPYSDPGHPLEQAGQSQVPLLSERSNYVRNSVKVVIDAYNGSVHFYVADPTDPIIRTWQAIFPQLFQPLDRMPAQLRSHIRYPSDLFSVQSERLMTYHMTDPQVFYNREDQWQIPTEIYGNQPQLVQPYYLITKLSASSSEEFILLLPYTPNQRTNLTAWLASRSDEPNYGKSLLYVFPKQQLVYGPEQIEARINQDPLISQQISLWNRQGSRALQGNLLVIPIQQSLLYVEPLYLEAEQNSLPTLVRVIVAYENRIVMAETLEQALEAIFNPNQPVTPAIVRPVQ